MGDEVVEPLIVHLVTKPESADIESSGAVVGGNHDQRVTLRLSKGFDEIQRFIELQELAHQSCRVVHVSAVINATGFNLEDESIFMSRQDMQRGARHLREAGHKRVFALMTINGKRQVIGRECSDQAPPIG